MKPLIVLFGCFVLVSTQGLAQDRIFRCGGEYTNSVSEAQARNCTPISKATPQPAAKPQRQTAKRYQGSVSSGTHEVEMSHNDELFLINGEKFSAKTYCFDVEKDDPVKFISGSPYGACASASFINLRTERVCEVWCD